MPRVRMSWRTFLGVCAGIFISLPLVVLWGTLLQPVSGSVEPAGARISPMLDVEQRARLITYGRTCESSAECEPPLGCFYESRYRHAYCTDSQCATDAQCSEGQVCRTLATDENGPLVRVCSPVGVRQEGESCFPVPSDPKSACVAGLLCAGKDYWCARPCHPGTPAECPEGFFCADTTPEPACLPTCEKQGCPAGEQCIRFREGSSLCAQVYGSNCQQSPCAAGEFCTPRTNPQAPGKVWLRCVPECGKERPSCPAGRVCDAYECLPACEPQNPATCDEGYRCKQPWPDLAFACYPDW